MSSFFCFKYIILMICSRRQINLVLSSSACFLLVFFRYTHFYKQPDLWVEPRGTKIGIIQIEAQNSLGPTEPGKKFPIFPSWKLCKCDVIVTSWFSPGLSMTVGKKILCWAKVLMEPMSGNERGKSYMTSTSVKNHGFRISGWIDVKTWKYHHFLA